MHEPALGVTLTRVTVNVIVAFAAEADQVVKAERCGLIPGAPHLPGLAVMHIGGMQPAPLALALIPVPRLLLRCFPIHTACSPGVRKPVQVHPGLLRAEKTAADLDP